ncbi:MAG: hypothetical protein SFX18_13785 [Pirellulales bacterium]|nr:hypothetical protein [Pirellulales bacterium]
MDRGHAESQISSAAPWDPARIPINCIDGNWCLDYDAENNPNINLRYFNSNTPLGSTTGFTSKGIPTPTAIYDHPRTNAFNTRIYEFESYAVCADNGHVLGGIGWGFTVLGAQQQLSDVQIPRKLQELTPTARDAANRYNALNKPK